jgi:uncharacterized protein (DUF2141 family)
MKAVSILLAVLLLIFALKAEAQQPNNIVRIPWPGAARTSSPRIEALAQSLARAALIVMVTGLRSQKGQVKIAVFNSPEKWRAEQPVYSLTINVDGPSVTSIINDVPEGYYAIAVLHDENSNGEMDKNILGMPLEPYGFSNNVRITLGPPKWENLKFGVKAPMTEISMEVR